MGVVRTVAVCCALLLPSAAWAGDVPLYQAAPAWVQQTELSSQDVTDDPNATILLLDMQQRIDEDRLWVYVDRAVQITSPELLGQLTTIALPWLPDKGDLIVHEISVIRSGETLDALSQGKRLEVLRREENLEQRQLTGILTATMALEGLRIGDVVRIRQSITRTEDALSGHVQSVLPIPAAPAQIESGRMLSSWPDTNDFSWQVLASGADPHPQQRDRHVELSLDLPIQKQPEVPDDAPSRFKRPALLEISNFRDWQDVSATMAPLYVAEGLIEAGSPLAKKVDEIAAANPEPLGRIEAALRVVQDEVRYLAVTMDGGNYLPQKPAKTWQLRYGDCKAKTLLLLAMLRELDIDAEAVLANTQFGDLVDERLPSAAAFNHVLVRAEVSGRPMWLDGTLLGTRLEDLWDTPNLGKVLPVRKSGAELVAIEVHPDARPTIDIVVDADESASVDFPSVYNITATLRGETANLFTLAASNVDAQQLKDLAKSFLASTYSNSQFSDIAVSIDRSAGTATLTAHGVATTPWEQKDKSRERELGRALNNVRFDPDRSKPEWSQIPVATPGPQGWRFELNLQLPDGGEGYVLTGPTEATSEFAGQQLNQTTTLSNGRLQFVERLDSTGIEIPVSQIGLERDRIEAARAKQPKIVGPGNATRRWSLGLPKEKAKQIAKIVKSYDQAIAEQTDSPAGYLSKANFYSGIGEFKEAREALSQAIEVSRDDKLYLRRAVVETNLGDVAAALADVEAARKIDPSQKGANILRASLLAKQGKLEQAISFLDERIALGGEARDDYKHSKASLIGEYGDPEAALALIDELLDHKPSDPALLNLSCWIKGTRSVAIDSALKDCTRAIELSTKSFAPLDSRALVWFRLGWFDEALKDLDAVLAEVPALPASRFMRAAVLAKLGRVEQSAEDLRVARLLSPRIDEEYEKFGIRP